MFSKFPIKVIPRQSDDVSAYLKIKFARPVVSRSTFGLTPRPSPKAHCVTRLTLNTSHHLLLKVFNFFIHHPIGTVNNLQDSDLSIFVQVLFSRERFFKYVLWFLLVVCFRFWSYQKMNIFFISHILAQFLKLRCKTSVYGNYIIFSQMNLKFPTPV